ncbi:acyltransferase family protein [Streptomyces cinnamoneus]|uniref:acyltransferase family protein n=1 Tax=Streptomyces cinnamoneus TaxID=53446 RepID=UPI0023D937D3|nr:acyltransferase [Streptomyces cinnamoneus]
MKGWDVVATNLTMLQQGMGVWDVDGVYWTLFIELKFYILFAIVVATGVTYRKCVLFCALWTVAAITAPSVDSKLLDMWAMPLASPYFVAGIAFYLMYRFKPTALLWGIVGVSFLLALHGVPKRVADNQDHVIPHWPAKLIILAAFVMMALIAYGKLNRIQWRWLTTAGALTYPLYLLHQYIGLTMIHWLQHKVQPGVLVLALTAVMLGAAWLMHRFVERPFGTKMRNALQKGIEDMRRNSSPAPEAAAGKPGGPLEATLPPVQEPRRFEHAETAPQAPAFHHRSG